MSDVGWDEVAARLARARIYWMHTTGTDGAPHASPVWGVVHEGVLFTYTFRSSVKARDLASDPRVVVHLESGSDVTIVHGVAVDVGVPTGLPEVVEAFGSKYSEAHEVPFLPSSDPSFDVMYSISPRRALLWQLPDSEASTRRWTSGSP